VALVADHRDRAVGVPVLEDLVGGEPGSQGGELQLEGVDALPQRFQRRQLLLVGATPNPISML
jgi:hypothetical protein